MMLQFTQLVMGSFQKTIPLQKTDGSKSVLRGFKRERKRDRERERERERVENS